jgi:hypothetical protein
MSERILASKLMKSTFKEADITPDVEDVIDPLDALEATDDYPIADELLGEDFQLDEEIEDSFPASDAPSSTPTTSLGAPRHDEEPV